MFSKVSDGGQAGGLGVAAGGGVDAAGGGVDVADAKQVYALGCAFPDAFLVYPVLHDG